MIANGATRRKPVGLLAFNLLAILIGLVAGLGAVVFRGLIAVFHNLLFLGHFSFTYDANLHTPPSPWGFLVILVPVVGAAGVAFLVGKFAAGGERARRAGSHGRHLLQQRHHPARRGADQVAGLRTFHRQRGVDRARGADHSNRFVLRIDDGAGHPHASLAADHVDRGRRGAGIAATFNTPIGGVLFAMEIMLHEVSARTMIPLAISTATATYVGRLFFGPYPSFVIPALETPYFHVANFWLLLSFVGLGILLGIVSAVYIKSIYAFEDFFEQRVKGNYYTRHMTGMLLVGVIMYLLMVKWGHYYIEGVGYATIQDVLTGGLSAFHVLLLLFVLKLLVTSLTLGSGASGGIFSPSLFMGATLGAAYGIALTWCFPAMDKSVAGFAIAGMAGVVGGATGAVMAAIVMIFEMTLDYNVIIPITITVALSYGVRKVLCPESIYTLKLTRRGHHIPSALHANFSHVKHVKDIMQTGITALPASSTLDAFAKTVLEHPEQSHFLVHDGDRIVGLVGREAAVEALGSNVLGTDARPNGKHPIRCRSSGCHAGRSSRRNVCQWRVRCAGSRQRQGPVHHGYSRSRHGVRNSGSNGSLGRFVLRLNVAENGSLPSSLRGRASEVTYVKEHSYWPGRFPVEHHGGRVGHPMGEKVQCLVGGTRNCGRSHHLHA